MIRGAFHARMSIFMPTDIMVCMSACNMPKQGALKMLIWTLACRHDFRRHLQYAQYFQTWTCGGRMEVVPCSRVGHVFRAYRPYSNPKGGGGTAHVNALRTAAVWLDEYKEKFFTVHPHLRQFDFGNVSDRVELRRKLQCRPFQWFLDKVYPELKSMGTDIKK